MNDRYEVIEDLQRTDFGFNRQYTIQEWREQAIEWAEMDEHYGVVEELKNLKDENVLDYISEFWQLRFGKVINYSYNIDDYGTLFLYTNKKLLATIENCQNMTDKEIENLCEEILSEKGDLTE